jgi:hypothetical protein
MKFPGAPTLVIDVATCEECGRSSMDFVKLGKGRAVRGGGARIPSVAGIAIVLAASLAVSAVARPAAAAEDVESLVRQGIELRKQGKEREALEVFERAAQIRKTPRVMAQVALAEQALGLWVKAEEHLKEAMATPGDPWIKKNRKTLDDSLVIIQDRLSTVEVWGEPAGAEVKINGELVGTLPATGNLRVPAGSVTLSVRANGHVDSSRSLELKKGDFAREHVSLQPAPRAPEGPTVPVYVAETLALEATRSGANGNAGGPPLIEKPGQGAAASDDGTPLYKRWWFWTIVGAVVVGGAATAFMLTRGGSECAEPGATCWN